MTQEQHVFVGTLADNLRLARVDVDRRGARGGARRRSTRSMGRGAAGRPRDGRRRRRPSAHAAAAAAGRARPARARRPAHARARRGDVAARPARRPPPRALARLRAHGPNGRRDRAPPADRARRRPRRGRRGRQAHRARHARRARRARRLVRRALGLLARRRLGPRRLRWRRAEPGFRPSSWTVRYSTRSSASCSRTSASQAFAAALPARARVSEPALPLLLAALHDQLERGLARAACPEDADARDAAEAAGWFLGAERVALLPEPRRPLGLRARAAAAPRRRARARARRARRAAGSSARPRPRSPRAAAGRASGPSRSGSPSAPSRASTASPSARARGLRARRARRGARPVRRARRARRRLPDDRPRAAADRVLRRRDRAGPRLLAVHAARAAPGRRAPSSTRRPSGAPTCRADARATTRTSAVPRVPDDLVPVLDRVAGPRLAARRGARASGRRRASTRSSLEGATELDPFPQGQPFAFEAQRPAIAARGLAEAENELAALRPRRPPRRRRLPAPRRGAPHGEPAAPRRRRASLEPGDELPARAGLRSRSRPRGAASSGATSASCCCPTRRSSASGRRAPTRGSAARSQSFADLRTGDYVVHEDHGVGKLLGFETKEVAGVTRDYLLLAFRGEDRLYVPHEQIGKVSRYIGADASAPTLSKLGGKAWQNLKTRARESRARARRRAARALRAAPEAPGVAYDLEQRVARAARGGVPLPRDRGPGARDRGGQGGPRGAAPDGPARLRRRRLRQDRGRRARRVRRRRSTASRRWCSCPTTILAEQHWNTFRERYRDFPVRVEMVSRFRKPAETKQILAGLRRGQGRRPHRHAPGALARRDPEGPRARDPRRGAALRRRAEGAAALAAARGRRARALGDADPAHAAHVALRACATSRSSRRRPRAAARSARRVGEYDEELSRSRSSASIARGGQAFYLHNRVETIDEAAEKLRQLCPELRFLVAHGQMRERELEEKMHAFLARRRGRARLDDDHRVGARHPAGEHADRRARRPLGLAQLYQIRGRVGRSDVTAHAYLFYPGRDAS